VIAFTSPGPSEETIRPSVSIDPSGLLEVVSPAVMLAGERVGTIRVRGLRAGEATLIMGAGRLAVRVVEPRVERAGSDARPAIVAPAPGACVWGVFSVGVERRVEPGQADLPVRLRLPDGRTIEPERVSDASLGPDRRAVFEIDASGLAPGVCLLTPVVEGEAGLNLAGDPVGVLVVRPDDAAVASGEAEASYDVARPRRFQDERASVGRAEGASGGGYYNNFAAYPALCFPVEVPEAGHYQVMLRAMGTLAGGELPWVDVVVDGADFPATGGPLVSMRWHRVPVGAPIWLEPGRRLITPFFANDFYVPDAADRNLMIDTIEVARVGPPGESAVADHGGAVGEGGLVIPALGADEGEAGPSGGDRMGGSMPASMSSMSSMSGGAMAGPGAGGAMAAMAVGGVAGGPSMPRSMASVEMLEAAGMATATPGNAAAYDPMGLASVPIRVALDRVLDGLPVMGEVLVEGQAWTPTWALPGERRGPAPEVTLLVNGREAGRQITFAPRFLIDAGLLDDGENTVQLIARLGPAGASGGGAEARTPVQRVRYQRGAGWTRPAPLRVIRLGVHDPAWDPRSRTLHRAEHSPRERVAIAMYSRETVRVDLPADLSGRFRIGVEALGANFEGAAQLSLRLESGREPPVDLGTVEAASWWDTRFIEPHDLPPGPKCLHVTFANDHYRPGAGDRNVWIQAVVLREEGVAGDEGGAPADTAPVAGLLYPRAGEEFWMAGAVVAEAFDDRGVARAELLIDGIETGVRRWARGQAGPIVLPVPARTLAPGEHTVQVRVYDERGNAGESEGVTIRVLDAEPPGGTGYDRAITLLDRFAFGPGDRELAAILSMGPAAWLEHDITRPLADAGELTAMGPGLIWFEDGRYDYGPPRRALEHAYHTPSPARARFVLWAQNHFSTWIRKAEGDRKWQEHTEFARLGAAPFADLLLASSRSPAMLRYLDQDQSYAGRLNENYAREIMELHTLGVDGGYSQADVTNLAGVLTGWTSSTLGSGPAGNAPRGFRFRFDPQVSSSAATTVVGVEFAETGRPDRYDRALHAIEALAAHPSTARHVAAKLCEAYVCVPPPEELVDDLALEFTRTGGDMAAMLVAMSEHPAFWGAARGRRLATPLDYALRLARGTGYHHPWRLGEFLQLSGFQVFDRSTPDGYPTEDTAYSDSNAMIQRWSLAQDASWALVGLVPDTLQWRGAATDRAWAQSVVDCVAIGLTGRVLGERSNQAAVDLLLESDAPPAERIRMIAPVIAQMPEANLK
jgi:hypothetical protein